MTNEKNKNCIDSKVNVTLQDLEKTTIAESLTFTAETLFSLLKQAEDEFYRVKDEFYRVKIEFNGIGIEFNKNRAELGKIRSDFNKTRVELNKSGTEFNETKARLNKSRLELNKADYRIKWIEGIIDLKYRRTIDDFYRRASEYIKGTPIQRENDKHLFRTKDKNNEDMLVYYIPDVDNMENLIKVEFHREKSDISGQMQAKRKFSLIKRNNKQGGYNE